MDIQKALRIAVDTGDVVFGVNQTRKAIEEKKAKLVVVASNCPFADLKSQTKVKVYEFKGSNAELGAACGKPFYISVLAVIDPGDSTILQT